MMPDRDKWKKNTSADPTEMGKGQKDVFKHEIIPQSGVIQ